MLLRLRGGRVGGGGGGHGREGKDTKGACDGENEQKSNDKGGREMQGNRPLHDHWGGSVTGAISWIKLMVSLVIRSLAGVLSGFLPRLSLHYVLGLHVLKLGL